MGDSGDRNERIQESEDREGKEEKKETPVCARCHVRKARVSGRMTNPTVVTQPGSDLRGLPGLRAWARSHPVALLLGMVPSSATRLCFFQVHR